MGCDGERREKPFMEKMEPPKRKKWTLKILQKSHPRLVIKFFPSIFTKYIYLFPNFQISAVL
jgi:hypothetical protein